jgi:dolichyl-phosphate-mannose--protein O-mannosyl transferase
MYYKCIILRHVKVRLTNVGSFKCILKLCINYIPTVILTLPMYMYIYTWPLGFATFCIIHAKTYGETRQQRTRTNTEGSLPRGRVVEGQKS